MKTAIAIGFKYMHARKRSDNTKINEKDAIIYSKIKTKNVYFYE